jgi:hypothetical protein
MSGINIQVSVLRVVSTLVEIRVWILVGASGILRVWEGPSMKHSFVRRTDGVNLNKANGETEWNSSRVCRNVMNSIRIGEPWIIGSVWNHCGIVTESVANWNSRFLCKENLDGR